MICRHTQDTCPTPNPLWADHTSQLTDPESVCCAGVLCGSRPQGGWAQVLRTPRGPSQPQGPLHRAGSSVGQGIRVGWGQRQREQVVRPLLRADRDRTHHWQRLLRCAGEHDQAVPGQHALRLCSDAFVPVSTVMAETPCICKLNGVCAHTFLMVGTTAPNFT